MGTRALIKIQDVDGEEICTIYTQYDGYPDGVMLDVARFLATRDLVNGITKYDVINGMDDLAAQVITLLKLKHYECIHPFIKDEESVWLYNRSSDPIHKMILAGTIYVMRAGTRDVDEEWVYVIKPDVTYKRLFEEVSFNGAGSKVVIEVYRPIKMFNSSNGLKLIWSGYPEEYVKEFGSKE